MPKKLLQQRKESHLHLYIMKLTLIAKDAYNREKYMKTQYGRNYIKKVLNNFFISKNFLG